MPDTYLTDRDIAARYSVHRTTPWRWAAQGRFPKPVKLSPQVTRWRASDVENWERRNLAEGEGEGGGQ